ncbi:MAG: AbrB/MazE/SpoVT family DNA-binding domain-containing protein [Gemmatimonadota bacterium]|jgi:bifunctional DNA-binding transcriptional regulator/antitoxin component of YhaV-PrlF toxin-antitoxin module
MALYRTLYYSDFNVGVGGRVTIPQDIRDDLGIADGDVLTARVEESPDGTRQLVMWRAKEQPEETSDD